MAGWSLLLLTALVVCASASPLRVPTGPHVASEVADLLAPATNSNRESRRLEEPKLKRASSFVSGKTDEGGEYKIFGSDAEGEKGYAKKSYSKGDRGYKSSDSFHKKIGDKYGFEEHGAFGDDGKAADKRSDDHEGAGTSAEAYYADEGDGGADSYVGYYSGEAEGGGGGSGDAGYYSGETYAGAPSKGSEEAAGSDEAYSGEDSYY